MIKMRKTATIVSTALAVLGLSAIPILAAGNHTGSEKSELLQSAHMSQGQGYGMMGPYQGYGMGPGMMGRNQGYGMGPGMMGPGMMGPGMMGPGMMGPGSEMMGPNQGYGMGPGMMGPQGYGMAPGYGGQQMMGRDLSADDVRHMLEHRLQWNGNERLKVGDVQEVDDDTITADIVTVDGSLVDRFRIDRHSGAFERAK